MLFTFEGNITLSKLDGKSFLVYFFFKSTA